MGLPTTDEIVARAEAQLGRSLPHPLRARLIKENGGTIEAAGEQWQLYSVFDTRDRKHATRSAINIVQETASAREWIGFPSSGIAIAHNGAGDRLILLPGAATVFVWRHDSDAEPFACRLVLQ